jgi:hypothetical protein
VPKIKWKCKSTAGGLQNKGLWIAGLQRRLFDNIFHKTD